jgi:hypothetical protein
MEHETSALYELIHLHKAERFVAVVGVVGGEAENILQNTD